MNVKAKAGKRGIPMVTKERGQGGEVDYLQRSRGGSLGEGSCASVLFRGGVSPCLVGLKMRAYFVAFAYLIPYINPVFFGLDLFAFGAHSSAYVDLQGCGFCESSLAVWGY